MNKSPLFAATVLLFGCTQTVTPAPAPENLSQAATSEAAPSKAATKTESSKESAAVTVAEVGKPAPDFALKDYDGKEFQLSALRGKTVVLEWFNPDCPYVKASHTKGSLKDTASKRIAKGVVWLAVNSAAPGKQGYGPERVLPGKQAFGLTHPILVDETGKVGRLYGATNTPQMYVIDAQGVLMYKGAIDNSPDGEGESPKDGKLINYVDAALDDLAAGRPVSTKDTKPYGCSVKYGS